MTNVVDLNAFRAARQQLQPTDDSVGQVVQSAVNLAITALKQHQGALHDNSYSVGLEGITSDRAAQQVTNKLNEMCRAADKENFLVSCQRVDGRIFGGLGSWVEEYKYIATFTLQKERTAMK